MLNQEQLPFFTRIINQLFELEKKIQDSPDKASITRNLNRVKTVFAEMGIKWENPQGEKYNETRTDCEASIQGEESDNLVIKEVIKPIIRLKSDQSTRIIQRALVLVSADSPE